MTRKSYLIAGLLSVTAIGGVAAAGQALQAPRGPMRADADNDGAVSRAEFFRAAEARFAERDLNRDRVLDGNELGRRHRGERQDTDGDGKVSFAEAAAATQARFARFDANRDGQLTAGELGPRHRGGPGRGTGGRRGVASAMLMRADANGDGRVVRDEARAALDARFDRLDANRDGAIDRAELRALGRGPGRGAPPAPSGSDD